MSQTAMSALAREILQSAAVPKGRHVKGRAEKAAARDLVARGLGQLNKSANLLSLTAAGHFVVHGTTK